MMYFQARSTWVRGWCTRVSNFAPSEYRDVYKGNWLQIWCLNSRLQSSFLAAALRLMQTWRYISGNFKLSQCILHTANFLPSTCLRWDIRPVLCDQNIRAWLFSSFSPLLSFCASEYLFPAHRCGVRCGRGKCSADCAGACGELERFQSSLSQRVGIL